MKIKRMKNIEYINLKNIENIEIENEAYNELDLMMWENLLEKIKENKDSTTERKYDLIVALSGGADSVVALYLAVKKYNLNPLVLTIFIETKGEDAMKNIMSITKYLGVDLLLVNKCGIVDFANMLKNGEEPCMMCNKLRYKAFKEVSTHFRIPIIITGGDLPLDGNLIVERDGIKYPRLIGLNKLVQKDVRRILGKLPWRNPGYSFSSTDCLICDVILIRFRELYNQYPESLWSWYSNRIRRGYIDKKTGYEELKFMVEKGVIISEDVCVEIEKNFGIDLKDSPFRHSF